jgi:hypothetical protein
LVSARISSAVRSRGPKPAGCVLGLGWQALGGPRHGVRGHTRPLDMHPTRRARRLPHGCGTSWSCGQQSWSEGCRRLARRASCPTTPDSALIGSRTRRPQERDGGHGLGNPASGRPPQAQRRIMRVTPPPEEREPLRMSLTALSHDHASGQWPDIHQGSSSLARMLLRKVRQEASEAVSICPPLEPESRIYTTLPAEATSTQPLAVQKVLRSQTKEASTSKETANFLAGPAEKPVVIRDLHLTVRGRHPLGPRASQNGCQKAYPCPDRGLLPPECKTAA